MTVYNTFEKESFVTQTQKLLCYQLNFPKNGKTNYICIFLIFFFRIYFQND